MKKITLVQLASKIAKLEGRKHQASIGDVREILKILCDMMAQELVSATPRTGIPGVDSDIEMLLWEVSRERADKIRHKKPAK